jgi:hypothetical protein
MSFSLVGFGAILTIYTNIFVAELIGSIESVALVEMV